MTERLLLASSQGFDPYENLALEEYLMLHTLPGECILYLWRNQCTVVIGKNQNAWKECRTQLLEEEGGRLARRLSGGGAVFQDLGNLNFTFLVRKEDYDLHRQTDVILRAVRSLGADARRTGRNDLTVDGRKFSGNAYYRTGDFCYHHGTLLLCADKEKMSRYLSVSREKLRSKSVESVKSRVANLSEFIPGLTATRMGEALVRAFSQVYSLPVVPVPCDRLDPEEVKALAQKFASWDWRYGQKIPFTDETQGRFPWGEVQVQLRVEDGRVSKARVWSDALDDTFPPRLEQALTGRRFSREELFAAVKEPELGEEIRRDLRELLAQFF